jgi:hypothetical protein
MPRRLNRRQQLENQAFLRALARSGNTRLAARELGVHRSTFAKRRAKHPAFAAEWDAALALAHARLNTNPPPFTGEGDRPKGGGGGPRQATASRQGPVLEPRVTRLANGRLQLRVPAARRIGGAARQAFLAALSATANVRLSARAAGFAHSSFYRLRDSDPAFAREMRMALQMGYDRIEMALLESFDPESARDDGWRSNDPPAIPPMSPQQAMQLLFLHQKEARLWAERPDRRRRRGDNTERYSARLGRKWRAEKAWDREGYEVASAIRHGEAPAHLEPASPTLPALEQVTGWSKADPAKAPHHPERALFGGWRLKDWEKGK